MRGRVDAAPRVVEHLPTAFAQSLHEHIPARSGLDHTVSSIAVSWPQIVSPSSLGLAASMVLLARASEAIPVGTAYAVWVGIGAALTVAYAMITGAEPFSVVRLLLILGLVACVVGLKLVGGDSPST